MFAGLDYRRRTVSENRRRIWGAEVQIFTVSLNGAKIYLHRFKSNPATACTKATLTTENKNEAANEQAKPEAASAQATTDQATTGQAKTDRASTGNENNHKTGNVSSGFDWVTERSSCTLPKVFNALRLEVEDDVKARNSLRPNPAAYEFLVTNDTGEFAVLLKAKELQKSVSFRLADNAILVRDDQGKPMFEVTLAFDDAGKCRLNVNSQEREFWQVRRMALEELMYRGL